MAWPPACVKTYKKRFRDNVSRLLDAEHDVEDSDEVTRRLLDDIQKETGLMPEMEEKRPLTRPFWPVLTPT